LCAADVEADDGRALEPHVAVECWKTVPRDTSSPDCQGAHGVLGIFKWRIAPGKPALLIWNADRTTHNEVSTYGSTRAAPLSGSFGALCRTQRGFAAPIAKFSSGKKVGKPQSIPMRAGVVS